MSGRGSSKDTIYYCGQDDTSGPGSIQAFLSDAVSHPSCWVLLAIRVVVICWWKSFVCV